jgi:hypothetical protein
MRESQAGIAEGTYRSLRQTTRHFDTRNEEVRTLDGVRHGADDRDVPKQFVNGAKEVCVW